MAVPASHPSSFSTNSSQLCYHSIISWHSNIRAFVYLILSRSFVFSFFADKLIHRPTHSLTHTVCISFLSSFLLLFSLSLLFFIACFLPNDDIAAVATEAAAAELLTGLQIDRQAITPVHWAYNGQILQQ